MKGKLSRSMSDMEGSVGGTSSTRPPASTLAPASPQWHPCPGAPADLTGWSLWTFSLQSACPQRGDFCLSERLCASVLWRLAVVSCVEACLIWRWSIRNPINTVHLSLPSVQLLPIIKPFLCSPVSQLVLNSGGQERGCVCPAPKP